MVWIFGQNYVDTQNKDLLKAASTGNEIKIQYLLKNGLIFSMANVNFVEVIFWYWCIPKLFQEISGDTVLHKACQGGHLSAVKKVVQYAPTLLDAKNNKHLTPLAIAQQHKFHSVVEYLESGWFSVLFSCNWILSELKQRGRLDQETQEVEMDEQKETGHTNATEVSNIQQMQLAIFSLQVELQQQRKELDELKKIMTELLSMSGKRLVTQ